MVFIGLDAKPVSVAGQGDDLRRPAAGRTGIVQRGIRPAEVMHRNQDPGFDAENKKVRAGVKHGALPGIHREEGHVDLFLFKRFDRLPEFSVRLFNFLHGGFIPPVPEVQVSRVEKPDAAEIGQETDAEIGGIKRGDRKLVRQLQRIAGGHSFAPGPHRHV